MTRGDELTDAEAQYLTEIWEDCAGCLGPGTELLDVQLERPGEGVRLVARYRLGLRERESASSGETMLAAHTELRTQILIDRIRFGLADLTEQR